MSDDARLAAVRAALGAAPDAVVRAPGRVNLLGGHVDYHEGPVVAMAIDRDVLIGLRVNTTGRVTVQSLDLAGTVDVAADGSTDPLTVEPAWGRSVAGVVATLARSGRPPVGFDGAVSTNLAIGAGLSSSAAFEVAIALALGHAAEWTTDVRSLALACQQAEHEATGVPCGIQDQLVSLAGIDGHALVIDCRDLAIEPLPLPTGVAVLVVHSGVPRTLAGSQWAARRAESEAAAAALGLRVLRDARAEDVADHPRARHVVAEIARVDAFADALRRVDIDALGRLMLAGHASLRDDMEVSTPELDALVECLVDAGAIGARLTGGGFGGCAVALVPEERGPSIAERASAAYRTRTHREPRPFLVRAASGAGAVASPA
ncbi:MAG TPA: galactokinase [Acidimicrobiia bacterium]|nr:galactokinase [Acidimicrobiia bacterium]